MSTDVIVMTFPENSVTYEAFSRLKSSEASASLSTAAIVERAEDGRMSIPEGDTATFGVGTVGGSVIGMLVGALGGPIGLLLGWGAGAATGALLDLDKGIEDDAVMSRFASTVKPGSNAIVAEGDEADPGVLDAFVEDFGGSIERASRDEVVAELEAQEAAAEDAAAAAPKGHARQAQGRASRRDGRADREAQGQVQALILHRWRASPRCTTSPRLPSPGGAATSFSAGRAVEGQADLPSSRVRV